MNASPLKDTHKDTHQDIHLDPLPLEDIQGNILRGYRMPVVRHFVLGIQTPTAAKQVLTALLPEGDATDLRITNAAPWKIKPLYCLNIAFTFAGLQALGLPKDRLDSFPETFKTGAANAHTATAIGDMGKSAPENWLPGLNADPGASPQIHILLSLYAIDKPTLETLSDSLRKLFTAEGAMTEYSHQDGEDLPESRVHFGYVDSLSQPHIEGAEPPKCACPNGPSKTGEFLLGYPGYYVTYTYPQPDNFGRNGTFCAYRVLHQDVVGFENYLEKAAAEKKLDKELIAAKMCGRWRNGTPLSLSPDTARPTPELTHEQMNGFDYRPTVQYPDANDDWRGYRCPLGSHIRRANPRSQDVSGNRHPVQPVNGVEQVTDISTPVRIIRRGIPYGPVYKPGEKPEAANGSEPERGLLLLILCASLQYQFEFLMTQWINGTDFTSEHLPQDPLLGNFPEGQSEFSFRVKGQPPVQLQGFSRFVETRGAAYGFIPSITALRYIAQPTY